MHTENRDIGIQFDLALFIRELKNNLIIIIMAAGIVAMGCFLVVGKFSNKQYTASCDLTAISQKDGYNNDYYVNIALTQYVSLLNSDALKNRVKEELGENVNILRNGSIRAYAVNKSNMIILQATANTPADAFKLLKLATESYPELLSKSNTGFSLEILGTLSTDTIEEVAGKDEVQTAVQIFAVVVILGSLLILLKILVSGKILNENQASRMLDADCLGSIYFEEKRKRQKGILVSHSNVSGFYIENIGKIVSKISYQMRKNKAKVLMVTSVWENEGKSTVAANIAITLAKRGNKVLLIDLDLKQPAVYKLFDLKGNQPTLLEYFRGESSFQDICIPTKEKRLQLCVGTEQISNSDKVLEGVKLRKLLDEAKKEMNYVIVDSTPCGMVGDAVIVTKEVDKTLLVVRQNTAKIRTINDCIDEIVKAGGDVLGCVLNGVVTGISSAEKKILEDNYVNE